MLAEILSELLLPALCMAIIAVCHMFPAPTDKKFNDEN
jgi:hypothetical protein